MLLGTNQTTAGDGDASLVPMMDATDYADFLQYVNSYNWSGVADVDGDDVSIPNFGVLDGSSSATGLDPATFWLNFSGNFVSIFNDSTVDPTVNNNSVDWIWEAGKLRIPLYRCVYLLF